MNTGRKKRETLRISEALPRFFRSSKPEKEKTQAGQVISTWAPEVLLLSGLQGPVQQRPPELQQPPELGPQQEPGGGQGDGHLGGHLGRHLAGPLGAHLGGGWHCCWFCWQDVSAGAERSWKKIQKF